MKYKLKTETVAIGSQTLRITALEDLDSTVDQLFDRINAGEDPRLLEDLCPYFGVVWPAALALCESMVAMGSTLKGARVLEVGCGLALPSLLAAKLGAVVTATDFHPDVPEFLKLNLAANKVTVDYRKMDWKDLNATEGLRPIKALGYDWVVGSDILYERDHPGTVAEALTILAGKSGRIIIADPLRPYLQAFVDEMKSRRWRADELTLQVRGKNGTQDILVLAFNRT